MEKRHYFEIPDGLNITSISRAMSSTTVTGYIINGVTYTIGTEQYGLVVTLPNTQPFSGILGYSDDNEIWTKDGLYLHKGGAGSVGYTEVYIKDFLENIPESYQSKMISDLTSSPTMLNTEASYLVNNTITPKEFHVIFNTASQQGVQDQVVAYVSTIYYVNSSNDYVPYQSNNIYGTSWAIPNSIYDPVATSNNLVSNGLRKDMVLKSNKLLYLMRYEGMLNTDVTQYLNGGLVFLNTTILGGLAYQVYMNPKFIYNLSGVMTNPLVEASWQTLTIENAFLHENLKGKVMKVW